MYDRGNSIFLENFEQKIDGNVKIDSGKKGLK
jgi:hypothetical protein